MNETRESTTERVTYRLRWIFEKEETTQKAFAEMLGIGNTQLNNWLVGKDRVSLEGSLKIYETFGISPDFLFLGRIETLPAHLSNSWAEYVRDSRSNSVND